MAAPSGLVANLYGPVQGKQHDSGMLADSALLNNLQIHSHSPNGRVLCIYGDPAYPLRQHLQAPFKGACLTPQQIAWNKSMSEVRVSVLGGGDFLMSGIQVCATDQGQFFTSKNPEQAPNFEVLLQNRPCFLKFYSRT